MELLKVENLTFTYPLCANPSLEQVSFSIEKGDFVTVCGATGSGKSTLLRMLKRELTPLGEKSGSISLNSVALDDLPEKVSACSIGFVMQKPEQQIVTDKVWHELAFGLENQGISQKVMARKVAEMSSYFGIESWYDKNVPELSGGQKQLLNLASIMVMNPSILILDEPTAQLDPIAASDFIATLKKLNRELALTIIIVEHRLEELIPISDKVLILEKGKLIFDGEPREIMVALHNREEILCAMPTATRLYHKVQGEGVCPLDIREGRNFIESTFENKIRVLEDISISSTKKSNTEKQVQAVQFKNIYFRYEKNLSDVLCGLNTTIYENEIFCILGGNGSGKTTMLSVLANLLKPYSGVVKVFGKKLKDYKNQSLYNQCLAFLPQDVQTVFLKNTVREELEDAKAQVEQLPFDLSYLYEKHPYDLSGGEQQLVALAKVLATKPKILLLDEPTKGLDAYAKSKIMEVMKKLKTSGMTIVTVTHDVEFASLCADRLALFFRGSIVSEGTPTEFFTENNFYTTAAHRMARGYYDDIVTVEQLVAICSRNKRKHMEVERIEGRDCEQKKVHEKKKVNNGNGLIQNGTNGRGGDKSCL